MLDLTALKALALVAQDSVDGEAFTWKAEARLIDEGFHVPMVVDINANEICEVFGGKERFARAEYIAAVSPSVVLELIGRVESERERALDAVSEKLWKLEPNGPATIGDSYEAGYANGRQASAQIAHEVIAKIRSES